MPKKPAPKSPSQPRSRPTNAASKGRNKFGDPRDTLYAGGTPLFDETGGGKRPPARKKKPAR